MSQDAGEARSSDLKPCPFCGCEGYVTSNEGLWFAGCNAGQVRVDDDTLCRTNVISFAHRTREGAIAAWNRRAPLRGGLITAEDVRAAIEASRVTRDKVNSEGVARFLNERLAAKPDTLPPEPSEEAVRAVFTGRYGYPYPADDPGAKNLHQRGTIIVELRIAYRIDAAPRGEERK